MSIRLLLAAAVWYFAPVTVLANNIMEVTSLEQPAEDENTVDESQEAEESEDTVDLDRPENIIRRQSLAAHLGLAPANVTFGQPRHFRSESLNNLTLDPLYEAEEN